MITGTQNAHTYACGLILSTVMLDLEKDIHKKDRDMFITKQKGILCGPLNYLAMYYLGLLEIQISTDLNYGRLYKNNPIGLVKEDHFFYVREKVFKKWVRANVTRILNTTKEQRKEDTEIQKRYEEDCRIDLEKELYDSIDLNERQENAMKDYNKI